jgi:DNA (cytosine-5)-methyltransferase 1
VAVILVAVAKLLWFVKSKRAQTSDDDETWLRGGVAPTLNAFDMGDTRATVIIFYGQRVGDFRVQDDKINTLQARMGTGGNNMPMVASVFPIDTRNALREPDKVEGPLQQGLGLGEDGDPSGTITSAFTPGVAIAFDTFNQTVSDKNQTIKSHSANNENIGTVLEKSTVRRLTPTECERLQGFPDGWTDGQADSHRYKQMGNAVAVPVVEWIINRVIK